MKRGVVTAGGLILALALSLSAFAAGVPSPSEFLGMKVGADRLTRRSAAVATTQGKGKLVLLGFRPQFRAQTPATLPFLFNALYWSTDDGSPPARSAKP